MRILEFLSAVYWQRATGIPFAVLVVGFIGLGGLRSVREAIIAPWLGPTEAVFIGAASLVLVTLMGSYQLVRPEADVRASNSPAGDEPSLTIRNRGISNEFRVFVRAIEPRSVGLSALLPFATGQHSTGMIGVRLHTVRDAPLPLNNGQIGRILIARINDDFSDVYATQMYGGATVIWFAGSQEVRTTFRLDHNPIRNSPKPVKPFSLSALTLMSSASERAAYQEHIS